MTELKVLPPFLLLLLFALFPSPSLLGGGHPQPGPLLVKGITTGCQYPSHNSFGTNPPIPTLVCPDRYDDGPLLVGKKDTHDAVARFVGCRSLEVRAAAEPGGTG